MENKKRIAGWCLIVIAVALMGLALRTSGLFRGLESGYIFHPDAPKQVTALHNFMEGRYVWYVGSLFYDGYPLGLNHVDEWILKPALVVHRTVAQYLHPDHPVPVFPDKITLYYLTHGLRVLYGMVCLWLMAIAARCVLTSSGGMLSAFALLALAPIPIMVAHFATGDIGADLFTLVTIVCLCRYANCSRSIWMLCAGLATGLSFSCKYNGALVGLAVAMVILLGMMVKRPFMKSLIAGFSAAFGLLAGVIIGTPAFLINGHRTWREMRDNFDFIRNYNVSPEFLAKPAWDRVLYSLSHNTPWIIASLGWIVTILAAAGLLMAAHKLRCTIRESRCTEQADLNRNILIFSLIVFTFLALFISLSGKPEVQSFHFSYLQAPLILAAMYTLRTLWMRPGSIPKIAAAFILTAAVIEFAIPAKRDNFFWSRADNLNWEKNLPSLLLRESFTHPEPQQVIKYIYLEPEWSGVFRNRASSVSFAHANFWNKIRVAPVPGIPLSVDRDWIFPNGPVFPRNDRMFRVFRDTSVTRQVVLYSPPGPIKIGLRSGSWPALVTLNYGGDQQTINLPPNSQMLVPVSPTQWRRSVGTPDFPQGGFIVPLSTCSRFGNATINVITTEPENHAFELYGGSITEGAQLEPADVPTAEMIKEIGYLRYLDGWPRFNVIEGTKESSGTRFPEEGAALACGPYVLQCEIRCLSDKADVLLKVDDLHRCKEMTVFEDTLRLHEGLNVITSRFTKAFAPYEVQMEIKSLRGHCRLESWTLTPDTTVIQDEFKRWTAGGNPPAWLKKHPGTAPVLAAGSGTPLLFAGKIRLTRLNFPATIHKAKPVSIDCCMEFAEIGLDNFQDYVVFIHLLDQNGHTVHQFHFPVWQAMAAGKSNIPLLCDGPTNIPAGQYGLELGVYNARTEKRVPIEGDGLSAKERKKHHHVFGKTTLAE